MKKSSFHKSCLMTLLMSTTLISACSPKYVYVPQKVKFDSAVTLNCPAWQSFVLPYDSTVDALIVNGADRLSALKQCNETIEALNVWNNAQ